VRLAPLRWWHLEQVTRIEREVFGDEEWSLALFFSELAQRDTRYYTVALDGEQPPPDGQDETVVGYAGLCVYGPEDAWVQNIAMTQTRRFEGHGGALLDDLLAEATRRGARRVSLEVRADNRLAQHVYARRGFEPVGLRRGYYQPSGADALVMARESAQVAGREGGRR
jgi:ribosomal-protein-alanine N-acetyltransferase